MDGTPFKNHFDFQSTGKYLNDFGYPKDGTERFSSGIDGSLIKKMQFVGSLYYYRLKHLVQNKINHRSIGKHDNETKQPLKGTGFG